VTPTKQSAPATREPERHESDEHDLPHEPASVTDWIRAGLPLAALAVFVVIAWRHGYFDLKNPQKLGLWLELNGKRVQNGSTATMVFGVYHIVAYLSQFFTLMPGDIITTGTPPGVGMGMKPQRFLQRGDTLSLGITGLGEQRQKVVAYTKT
jgi:2-keto-4-pentenoate hydratase/2-oxohepta-3-ene-1,7-dioic acid hydratase in catechol pathway